MLTSIADFSFAVSTAPEENVEGADAVADDVLLMKMNPHEMSMSFRCKDETLLTKVKEEKLSFNLKEERKAQVILDMSVYMSRFIGVSLKFPRIYLECVRQEMEEDGSFNLRIRVLKMDNSQGGILTRVLPLKKLSKLLNEGFEVSVNVNGSGQLLISYEVRSEAERGAEITYLAPSILNIDATMMFVRSSSYRLRFDCPSCRAGSTRSLDSL